MNRDGLRVALLTPCFWPEVRRGGERLVRELADGLLVRGHRPRLITSHPGWPRRTMEDGLPILRLPRPPQGRLLRRHYEPYLTHVPLSYLALRTGEYQLAHAVHPPDAMAAIRWKKQTGRPAILSYLGIPDRRGLTEYRRRLDLLVRAGAGCDAVVALSRYAAEAFDHWLGVQARVIPPGVNLEALQPSAQRASRPTIICSAAAEVPRKNVRLLVRAFELVRRRHPDARLILSRPQDPQAARQTGVELRAPGVEWRNLDERAELARAYGESWAAALPAVDEAFGLVIVEALACGTPVAGYAHAAIPEVIDSPRIGRLFDRLEPGELARVLEECLALAEDPATAQRCRNRAEEFSVDRCVDAYVSLYRELLGQEVHSSRPAVTLTR